MFQIKLESFDQIYEGKHDIYIVCHKQYDGRQAYKDLQSIFYKKDVIKQSTQYSITLQNGCKVYFVNDSPNNFRGLHHYYYATLDDIERMIKEEMNKNDSI